MTRRVIIILIFIVFVIFVLLDSGAISAIHEVEEKLGYDQVESHYEWHPERIPQYFRDIWRKLTHHSTS